MATALGIAACNQGNRVRFYRVTELITLLMEAREERQLLRHAEQHVDSLARFRISLEEIR